MVFVRVAAKKFDEKFGQFCSRRFLFSFFEGAKNCLTNKLFSSQNIFLLEGGKNLTLTRER